MVGRDGGSSEEEESIIYLGEMCYCCMIWDDYVDGGRWTQAEGGIELNE